MSRTILVPLDGSPLAERALPYAAALARATGSQLLLLSVVAPPSARSAPEPDLTPVVDRMRAGGVMAEPCLYRLQQYQDVAGAVGNIARERPVQYIVMSTHGRGGLGRSFLGSVADRVIREAEVPVLLISAACGPAWTDDRPRRILVPLDGSALAEEALGPAGRLAEQFAAEPLLLQVVGPPLYALHEKAPQMFPFEPKEEVAEARRYLAEIANRLPLTGRPAEIYSATGYPASAIATTARQQGADLIVMATHGHGGLSRLVMGSVATGVLERAHLPLLLVRPSAVGHDLK